jgi:hypothetical protein
VSILYADVVRYTQMTTSMPVRTLVETLHELFVKFDEASAVSWNVFFSRSRVQLTRLMCFVSLFRAIKGA